MVRTSEFQFLPKGQWLLQLAFWDLKISPPFSAATIFRDSGYIFQTKNWGKSETRAHPLRQQELRSCIPEKVWLPGLSIVRAALCRGGREEREPQVFLLPLWEHVGVTSGGAELPEILSHVHPTQPLSPGSGKGPPHPPVFWDSARVNMKITEAFI